MLVKNNVNTEGKEDENDLQFMIDTRSPSLVSVFASFTDPSSGIYFLGHPTPVPRIGVPRAELNTNKKPIKQLRM